VPVSQESADVTWADAHTLVRAAGKHAAPVPLAETIMAGWLLGQAGLEVPLGPLTIAPVHRDERLRLERAGSGGTLHGTVTRVPWGARAGHVVVVAEGGATPVIALVAKGAGRVTADRSLALEPRDTLAFDGAPVVAAAPARVAADAVALYGAMVRSAQMAGALESLLEQSVRYATERKQVGRPIGNCQAIQHNLALLAG